MDHPAHAILLLQLFIAYLLRTKHYANRRPRDIPTQQSFTLFFHQHNVLFIIDWMKEVVWITKEYKNIIKLLVMALWVIG